MQELNEKQNAYFRNLTYLLLAVSAFFLIRVLFWVSASAPIAPGVSDDYPYLSGAQVYSEIHTVKARTLINESVSRIFECDWYGFGYPIFYGTLFTLFGNSEKIFIYSNFACLALIALLWLKGFRHHPYRNTILLCFLSCTHLAFFMLRFAPVCLTLLQGFALFLLLYRYSEEENSRKKIRILWSLILLSLVFSLFRNYLVFILLGLVPLSKNKKELLIHSSAFAGGFMLSALCIKLFTAINLDTFMAIDGNAFQDTLKSVSIQLHQNYLVVSSYFMRFIRLDWRHILFPYFFILIAPFALIAFSVYKKDRFALAISAVAGFHFIVMLFIYPLDPDYYFRHSSHLLLPLFFILFSNKGSVALPLGIAIVLVFTNIKLHAFGNSIQTQIQSDAAVYAKANHSEIRHAMKRFPAVIDDSSRELSTVLVHQSLINTHGIKKIVYTLPFVSNSGKLIRYTFIPKRNEEPLHLFHRIPVHYFLVPASFDTKGFEILDSNSIFKFLVNPDTMIVGTN